MTLQFSREHDDRLYMDLALRLGRRGAGQTAENPAVGCVLVAETSSGPEIVGRGWTQPGGRPHAERVALAEAGDRANGATAYVTLEPCSHFGKTSPCAKALIEAGISRVVCAHPDPDERVAGRGFAMLREAGIDVEEGLLQSVARHDLAGFLSRTTKGRPWMQAKMALSPDGMIGSRDKGNLPITGPQAKSRTYGLRARADAILVGVDTVLIDDPSLTVRSPGLEPFSPTRVVLDSRGRISMDAHLVKTAKQTPVWIITTGQIAADKALELERMGCQILLVDELDGHANLTEAATIMGAMGINKAFCEPGALLSKALLKAGLIDEFYLYQGNQPVGEGGVEALNGQAEQTLLDHGFVQQTTEYLGADLLRHYLNPTSLEELAAPANSNN